MDTGDLLRLVNAVLALASAVGYAHSRVYMQRHRLSGDEMTLRLGLVSVLFFVSLGTAEAIALDNELVLAQFGLTFGYVAIIVGLWHTRPRIKGGRP
jgi:hypothetical protein